jgi:hypothetical protein
MSKKRTRDEIEKPVETNEIVIRERKEVDVKKPQGETCWYFKTLQDEPSCDFFGTDAQD